MHYTAGVTHKSNGAYNNHRQTAVHNTIVFPAPEITTKQLVLLPPDFT